MANETCKTIEVTGPAGRMIINESDISMYKNKGYSLVDTKTEEAPKKEASDKPEKPADKPADKPVNTQQNSGQNQASSGQTGNYTKR